jgi:ribosomal protein L19
MAVTVSDPYSPGKVKRFVGICIRRDGYGLRHTFTLRNVIEGLGNYIEIKNILGILTPIMKCLFKV